MFLIHELNQTFHLNADASIAIKKCAYMRGLFPFFGLETPLRRTLQKPLYKSNPLQDEWQLKQALQELWSKEQREFQYAALDIARHFIKFTSTDMLEIYEVMIRTKSWWDTVDDIAAHLVGSLLLDHPKLIPVMDRWIEDENLWIKRTALIFQLKWKQRTDTDRLFTYCHKQMHDPDFFIRKAIGWALRQYSKTDPLAVKQFIQNHQHQLIRIPIKNCIK